MTREDAKTYLIQWQQSIREYGLPIDSKPIQAYRVAIEALSEPSRRQGRWIKYMMNGRFDHYMCDRCKSEQMEETNFCPKCGAAMERREP